MYSPDINTNTALERVTDRVRAVQRPGAGLEPFADAHQGARQRTLRPWVGVMVLAVLVVLVRLPWWRVDLV